MNLAAVCPVIAMLGLSQRAQLSLLSKVLLIKRVLNGEVGIGLNGEIVQKR